MKAKELMIGDRVKVKILNEDGGRVLATKKCIVISIPSDNEATVIYEYLGDTEEETVYEEQLIPITLTESILKKNGFVKKPHSQDKNRIVYTHKEHTVSVELDTNWIYAQKGYARNILEKPHEPLYVHNLQHILNECKIEEEIVV